MYVFYLDLVTTMLHLVVYLFFFIIVFNHYGLPLHLMRDLYWTFRNFRNRVSDFLRYRRVTVNMDSRFPEATAEVCHAIDMHTTCQRVQLAHPPAYTHTRMHAMTDSFQDLERCDAICIVCREEMTLGAHNKKLPCGHVFHLRCLRCVVSVDR